MCVQERVRDLEKPRAAMLPKLVDLRFQMKLCFSGLHGVW